MPRNSPANLRAFVRRNTCLLPVPDLPGMRLQLAGDVRLAQRRAADELGDPDASLPFWAFAWTGGLAVARYLIGHPEEVAGRRVVDAGAGSGMCAIVALRCGALAAHAFDVDPLSEAAVALNARANGVRVGFSRRNLLDAPPPPADVILAGDVFYEETMAAQMLDWLRLAARNGARVLIGDPRRRYLPAGLECLAVYRVHSSREIESSETTESAVFTFPVGARAV